MDGGGGSPPTGGEHNMELAKSETYPPYLQHSVIVEVPEERGDNDDRESKQRCFEGVAPHSTLLHT